MPSTNGSGSHSSGGGTSGRGASSDSGCPSSHGAQAASAWHTGCPSCSKTSCTNEVVRPLRSTVAVTLDRALGGRRQVVQRQRARRRVDRVREGARGERGEKAAVRSLADEPRRGDVPGVAAVTARMQRGVGVEGRSQQGGSASSVFGSTHSAAQGTSASARPIVEMTLSIIPLAKKRHRSSSGAPESSRTSSTSST